MMNEQARGDTVCHLEGLLSMAKSHIKNWLVLKDFIERLHEQDALAQPLRILCLVPYDC